MGDRNQVTPLLAPHLRGAIVLESSVNTVGMFMNKDLIIPHVHAAQKELVGSEEITDQDL